MSLAPPYSVHRVLIAFFNFNFILCVYVYTPCEDIRGCQIYWNGELQVVVICLRWELDPSPLKVLLTSEPSRLCDILNVLADFRKN